MKALAESMYTIAKELYPRTFGAYDTYKFACIVVTAIAKTITILWREVLHLRQSYTKGTPNESMF